jgi:hypothetical protein
MSAPLMAAQAAGQAKPQNLLIVGGVVVGVTAIAYFGIVRPVMKRLGLIPDRKYIKNLAKISDYKGFDPTFYRPTKVTLSPERAKILADTARNSVGVFNDNESALYAVLQEAGTPDNLSYLAKIYNIRHKGSLGQLYFDYMGRPDEVARIKQILMSYPY